MQIVSEKKKSSGNVRVQSSFSFLSFFRRGVNNGVTKVQKYPTIGNTANAARPRAGACGGLPAQVTAGVLPRTSGSVDTAPHQTARSIAQNFITQFITQLVQQNINHIMQRATSASHHAIQHAA